MKTDEALPIAPVTKPGEAAPNAESTSNGVVNGVAKGSASGSGAFTSRDDLPDVRDTVVAAAAVADKRAMPLRPAAMTPQQTTGVAPANSSSSSAQTADAAVVTAAATASGTQAAAPRGTMPQAAPWNQLPPGALEEVRPVDIMRSLSAIGPQMKAVEKEIERLITTPVKLIADLASHTMGAGGKRLRPALTILAAQLCVTMRRGPMRARHHLRRLGRADAHHGAHPRRRGGRRNCAASPPPTWCGATRPVCWWAIICSRRFS